MSNPAGKKGWAGEAPVLDWLKKAGFSRAYRLRSQGSKDRGDIGGIDDVAIEVKNVGKYSLSSWMKELKVEKANARARSGALIMKPKGVGAPRVAEWWVVMTVEDYTQLLIDAGYGPYEEPQ